MSDFPTLFEFTPHPWQCEVRRDDMAHSKHAVHMLRVVHRTPKDGGGETLVALVPVMGHPHEPGLLPRDIAATNDAAAMALASRAFGLINEIAHAPKSRFQSIRADAHGLLHSFELLQRDLKDGLAAIHNESHKRKESQ